VFIKIYSNIGLSLAFIWWYAKRFLHPDVVAAYDYIFIWDEDLGVENFNAEKYALFPGCLSWFLIFKSESICVFSYICCFGLILAT